MTSSRLEHLTGARCLASTWIVCGHFLPPQHTSVFSPARYRADAAVCFFVIMSGYLTHWVYSDRMEEGDTWASIWAYYKRRFSKVIVTTWVAMLAGLAVVIIQLRGGFPPWRHVLLCFTFLEPWRDPCEWCPNGQTWTVAALLPCWLLYPAMKGVARSVGKQAGVGGLISLSVLCWLLSFGPSLFMFCYQDAFISIKQGLYTYVWPPAQIPDFVLGVAVAEISRLDKEHEVQTIASAEEAHDEGLAGRSPEKQLARQARMKGAIADIAILVGALLVFCVPPGEVPRQSAEVFYNHGLAPFLALFLYGSSAQGGSGLLARLFRHDALVSMGEYSFQVYLFQYPWHEIFVAIGDVSKAFDMRNAAGTHNVNMGGFMFFFVTLWILAALYMDRVEPRLVSLVSCQKRRGKELLRHDKSDSQASSA